MGEPGVGRRAATVAALIAMLSTAGVGAGGAASAAPRSAPVGVVVIAAPGQVSAVEADVVALGGRVGRPLPIISGFAASVPSDPVSYTHLTLPTNREV